MPLKERARKLIKQMRERITDPGLCTRHRRREVDFSRQCRLTFPVLMLLLLQKSVKSLQSRLHEWLWQLTEEPRTQSLSPGAFTHARAKLCASVFMDLNQQVLWPTVYGPEHQALVQRWRGHRLLGVDSTVTRLPKSAAVGRVFGWEQCRNDRGTQERYPFGRLSIIYDLLNELALDARLVGKRVNLHPVWVIFSLLAFGDLFGLLGLLIAVPVAAILGVLIRFALQKYLASPIYDPAAVARDDIAIRP